MIAATSRAAYQPETRAPQERAVLEYIVTHPGCTREEVAQGLNIKESSVCGRVDALKKAGIVKLHGQKFTSTGSIGKCLYAVAQQEEIDT